MCIRDRYKTFVFNNEALDNVLEDQSLYWNDDKEIVDTFVLKTIKRFEEKNGCLLYTSDAPLFAGFGGYGTRLEDAHGPHPFVNSAWRE